MIDLTKETPVPLIEILNHRLLSKMGQKGTGPPIRQTVAIWCLRGCSGVKLEWVQMPAGICTTEEALIRFIERLSMPAATSTTRTPSDSRRGHKRADETLSALGM